MYKRRNDGITEKQAMSKERNEKISGKRTSQ